VVTGCLNGGEGLKETLPPHESYPAPGDTRGDPVSVLCPHVAHHTSSPILGYMGDPDAMAEGQKEGKMEEK